MSPTEPETPDEIARRLHRMSTEMNRTPDQVAMKIREMSAELETLADRLERFVAASASEST